MKIFVNIKIKKITALKKSASSMEIKKKLADKSIFRFLCWCARARVEWKQRFTPHEHNCTYVKIISSLFSHFIFHKRNV